MLFHVKLVGGKRASFNTRNVSCIREEESFSIVQLVCGDKYQINMKYDALITHLDGIPE